MEGFRLKHAVPLHEDWEIPANALIRRVRLIAKGSGIRRVQILTKLHGGKRKNWKKFSGMTTIINGVGEEKVVEVHWYDCHGIGRDDWKEKIRDND